MLGRSRGGLSTKIHASTDALGNPTRFILTGGERPDCEQAVSLLNDQEAGAVLADKGYEANYIVDAVRDGNTPGRSRPKQENDGWN